MTIWATKHERESGTRSCALEPVRALGYVRVSTEEQAREGVSLNAQEARIRAYASAKDLDLIDVIRDEGLSGKDLDRPGVQRLISACGGGDVSAVVVVKLDRLSRRTRDLLYLVEDVFQARDVALHSLHETVDTSSASGRFFLRIMGALAEMERELIGERTAAALAHKKALGERLGTTPLGHRTPGHRMPLEAVAEEQAVIVRVLALWREGRSYPQVATTLNAEGARTKHGARWHHSTVDQRGSGCPQAIEGAAGFLARQWTTNERFLSRPGQRARGMNHQPGRCRRGLGSTAVHSRVIGNTSYTADW
jgi:DNA invertase Pin-like site-specific DNA recombinase